MYSCANSDFSQNSCLCPCSVYLLLPSVSHCWEYGELGWVVSGTRFSKPQREASFNPLGCFYYSLMHLKHCIFNGIGLASYIRLSLEGLVWDAKECKGGGYLR